MCGIVGIIAYNRLKGEDVKVARVMQDKILHRGPDNQSIWSDESIVFGHNRLSIIDLSSQANQPMVSINKNVVISFNGEIYNHKDIKKDLIKTQAFQTDHSDTEVIINAYLQWGLDKTLERLKGMFAFALYDKKKQITYLVRDRLGKKPLYYIKVNNKLYFSSEIKALLAIDEVDKTINDEAIYHYLTFLTVNAPNTFYKKIKKLEAGTYLKINKKGIDKKEYWSISDAINKKSIDSYEEAKIHFNEKIEKSMLHRIVSDVPISIALSGGIDSSLNLYYCSLNNPYINAINIEYETQHKYNESVIAKRFSTELSIKYHQITINNKEFEKQLNELIDIQVDMPIGDPSSVLIYVLAKKAKEIGSKILIVGEGGDELGGYSIYTRLQKEYNIINQFPKFIKNRLKYIPLRKPYDFFYNGELISRRQVHGFTEFEKEKFWIKEKYNSYKILYDLMEEITINTKDKFIKKIVNIEYKLRLSEFLLSRVDSSTMATGIEARSPYMDYQLVEHNASLPFSYKMKHGVKSIAKELAKGILPDYIINGKKIGFSMVLHPFLTKSLPEIFKNEVVNDKSAPIKEYIDEEFIKEIVEKEIFPWIGNRIWILYSLNKWLLNHKKRYN